MKKLVLLACLLLVGLALKFPNGVPLPVTTPDAVVVPAGETDAALVGILEDATDEDKARIVSVYEGMQYVLKRDNGKRINTTDKFSDWQANTLQLAVETPGKYPGLDKAIEAVFVRLVGTDDVVSTTPDVQQKLIKACEIVAASAKK
jgi:hypothetical protein